MVDPDDWGDALRRCFSDAVAGGRPTRAGLATEAAARAGRVRRRRRVAGALLTVTLLVAGVTVRAAVPDWSGERPVQFGVASDGGDGGEDSDASGRSADRPEAADPSLATIEGLSVDLFTDRADGMVLATRSGDTVDLSAIRGVVAVHEAPGGWAVISDGPDARELWWVAVDAPPVELLPGVDAVVVDRGRVAYQQGGQVSAARLAEGTLVGQVHTTVPAGGRVAGFLGDQVVLERAPDGAADPPAEASGWSLWDPAGGTFQPAWSTEVSQVFGAVSDDAGVGLAADGPAGDGACLARFPAAAPPRPEATACLPVTLAGDAPATVSASGRWLLATTTDRAMVLVDLAGVFRVAGDQEAVAATVYALPEVPPPAAPLVWLAADTVVVSTTGSLIQVNAGRVASGARGAVEWFPFTGAPPLVVAPG